MEINWPEIGIEAVNSDAPTARIQHSTSFNSAPCPDHQAAYGRTHICLGVILKLLHATVFAGGQGVRRGPAGSVQGQEGEAPLLNQCSQLWCNVFYAPSTKQGSSRLGWLAAQRI